MDFDSIPRELWIQFTTKEEYESLADELDAILAPSEGKDRVGIFIKEPRMMKKLPPNQNVRADKKLLDALVARFGESNIKLM